MRTKPRRATAAGSIGRQDDAYTRHRERLLDEALADTFPASDPPSIAMPH
jgi:hypothetical protein